MEPSFKDMSWHQQNRLRRLHQTRHLAAHIPGPDYIATGLMLCGRNWRDTQVTVSPQHANSPTARTCRKCLAALARTAATRN